MSKNHEILQDLAQQVIDKLPESKLTSNTPPQKNFNFVGVDGKDQRQYFTFFALDQGLELYCYIPAGVGPGGANQESQISAHYIISPFGEVVDNSHYSHAQIVDPLDHENMAHLEKSLINFLQLALDLLIRQEKTTSN
jgi:hypothetical protein